MDDGTADEARERVCDKAFDLLTNGRAFEIMDGEDRSVLKYAPGLTWETMVATVAAVPDDRMLAYEGAYVDDEGPCSTAHASAQAMHQEARATAEGAASCAGTRAR